MRPGFVHGARLTWSPSGTPYTDLLVALCARVTPAESAVTGGSGLVELAALGAVALVAAGAPPADGIAVVALRDGVTLPLVAVRAAGVVSAVARRFVDALRR
jgi:hypothetical protein